MSVEAMAIVLHHSKATGTAKVVLIGIANHDGDGGAWPSIETLAKYANVEQRTVQRALRELEEAGEIRTVRQAGGMLEHRNDRRPNRYQVLVACPDDCDRSTNHRRRGDVDVTPSSGYGVTPVTPRGDAGDAHGVTPASPEPSLEPSRNRGGSRRASSADGPSTKPPPMFCPDHPAGTTQPCRACAVAGRARDVWDREDARLRERERSEARRRADAETRRAATPPPPAWRESLRRRKGA